MKFLRILVPVSGAESDKEAVQLGCRLAKESKGKVYVIHVIKVRRSLPLDAEMEPDTRSAERILQGAEDSAHQQDYRIETDLLQTREAGPAIVTEAVERQVDLIVMGMTYRKRFGRFELGETIPYVLKNSPCRVMVLRQPAPEVPE
jgi:nucleotide-binding universal stress UspA family protein